MKCRKIAAAISALVLFSSCAAQEGGGEYSETMTVSITAETTSPAVTEETKKGNGILGDYTEAVTSETLPENGDMIFLGAKYHADERYVTIDADICSEVTDEDLKSYEKLKENGLRYIDVINCEGNDLSFLSKLDGIYLIRLWNVGNSRMDFLRELSDDIKSVVIINFKGDPASLSGMLKNTDIKNVSVYSDDFSVYDGIVFTSSAGKDRNYSYGMSDDFTDTPAPADEPYAVSTPCVYTYDDGQALFVHVDKEYKGVDGSFIADFFNPTDEDIFLDSVSITGAVFDGDTAEYTVRPGVTVPAHHQYRLELKDEMYGISSGIHKAVFSYGEPPDNTVSSYFALLDSKFTGLERLNDEQRSAFEKAYEYMWRYFSVEHYIEKEYAESHTAEEFISQFTDAMTYELAEKLSESYIGEDGKLIAADGARGGNITVSDWCFYVTEEYGGINITPVSVHRHDDFSYRNWLETCNVHLTETPEGWRVDKFSVWW